MWIPLFSITLITNGPIIWIKFSQNFIEKIESDLLKNSYYTQKQPFRNSTGQNVLSFVVTELWNKILEEIKRTKLNTFKHNLKKYYLKGIGQSNF